MDFPTKSMRFFCHMNNRSLVLPRILFSALSGGSGKTLICLAVAHELHRRGLRVKTFKKGPDFIDALWLSQAAQSSPGSLDPYFSPPEQLVSLVTAGAAGSDLVLIEGNRGLFDGVDAEGSCSTASLARMLQTPTVLIIDCTKMTRTTAALLHGCATFEPDLPLRGVILNQLGSVRHEKVIRESIEKRSSIPILGAIPRHTSFSLPERSTGLGKPDEESFSQFAEISRLIAQYCDLDALLTVAGTAPALEETRPVNREKISSRRVRIAYALDAAFWFYYSENLEALTRAGAELVPFSPLSCESVPDCDGIYLGGGRPEEFLEQLGANTAFLAELRHACSTGLPVYAEGAGIWPLTEAVIHHGVHYPMSGLFPYAAEITAKPQGLGYTAASITAQNAYFPLGHQLKGHEFHYSRLIPPPQPHALCLEMTKGRGMTRSEALAHDGLFLHNTFAACMHLYAPACPDWAPAFITACLRADSL